jgi:hypothetical protein
MNPAVIVIITEVLQLPLQISDTPERNVIQQFSPHCSYQSLNEWTRFAAAVLVRPQ